MTYTASYNVQSHNLKSYNFYLSVIIAIYNVLVSNLQSYYIYQSVIIAQVSNLLKPAKGSDAARRIVTNGDYYAGRQLVKICKRALSA